jgi:UDP-N-acetyl-D-mannosaminuronic acid dehydrogenase
MARKINDEQPVLVADLVEQVVSGLNDKRIAILGMAYKANVDDLRESPAIEIVKQICSRGGQAAVFEPNAPVEIEGIEVCSNLEQALRDAEALLLLVDHDAFHDLEPETAAGWMSSKIMIDTRDFFDRSEWEDCGFAVYVLGVGQSND